MYGILYYSMLKIDMSKAALPAGLPAALQVPYVSGYQVPNPTSPTNHYYYCSAHKSLIRLLTE